MKVELSREELHELLWRSNFAAEERRQELMRRQAEEKHLREELLHDTENWSCSVRIREYLEAYRIMIDKLEDGDFKREKEEWLGWAIGYADSIDPLNQLDIGGILDEKKD